MSLAPPGSCSAGQLRLPTGGPLCCPARHTHMMSQRPLPVLFVFLVKQGHEEDKTSVDFLPRISPVNLGVEAGGLCSEKAPYVGPLLSIQGLGSPGEDLAFSKASWASPFMARRANGCKTPPVKGQPLQV